MSLRLIGFNGEDAFIGPKGPAVPRDTRSVPAVIEFEWTPPDGHALRARITFDEAEIFAAFRKLSPGDAQRPLSLHLEPTAATVSVALPDERYLLPLEKAQVKIHSR